jgi:hypothetical protein
VNFARSGGMMLDTRRRPQQDRRAGLIAPCSLQKQRAAAIKFKNNLIEVAQGPDVYLKRMN